jgi:hypothetical protein
MNVNTIIHVKVSLAFDWYFELVVDEIEKDVRSLCIWSCDGEVVNLTFEENTVAVDVAGVEARFVHGRGHAYFS